MEHLENDMDDLFRKAGDQYPLKITGSDWDGVLGKLNNESAGDEQVIPILSSREKNRKRRWFLLFLLIPLGLGTTYYFSTRNKPADSGQVAGKSVNSHENKSAPTGGDTAGGTPAAGNAEHNQTNEKRVEHGHDETRVIPSNGQRMNISHPSSKKQQAYNLTDEMLVSGTITNTDLASEETAGIFKPLTVGFFTQNGMVDVQAAAFTPTTAKADPITGNSDTVHKKQNDKPHVSKGFYVGILAGPDLSTVKFQSVEQPGFSIGALIGYRFNQRLSIETGLLWDKKYYYSTGKYFDKSKTPIPTHVNISDLEGYCNMFEIPLALRYDFATKKNHGFFAKAGLTSYLMKEEQYDINAELYGNPVAYTSPPYKNSTNNIFSIIQLSAGYERALSGKTKIRIEPYLKIPLGGVGIGSMPISSFGFYLGVSHSFR